MWTYLLTSVALGAPDLDDLDAWEAILQAAERGPDGCWEATGDVHWRIRSPGKGNEGRAPFTVRFADHRFGPFTLFEPQITIQGGPGLVPDDLTLQFRPLLGLGGSGWWLVDNDMGVYLRDRDEGEPTTWVPTEGGTLWVEPFEGTSVRVFRAEAIGDRSKAPEATAFAVVPEGWGHAERLVSGREPHMQQGNRTQHRSDNEVHFAESGLPLSERRRTEFRFLAIARSTVEHDITYTSWTRCGEAVVPEVAGTAAPEGLRPPGTGVLTPRSVALMPSRTVAFGPALDAQRQELLWSATNHRRQGRNDLVQAGIIGGVWGASMVAVPWVRDEPLTTQEVSLLTGLAGAVVVLRGASSSYHFLRARKKTRDADALTAVE